MIFEYDRVQYSEWPLQVDAADSVLDESAEGVGIGRLDARETSVLVAESANTGWRSKMMLSTARVTPLRQPIILAICVETS